MSGFLKPLRMEETDQQVDGRTVYRLLEPVVFHVGCDESSLVVVVPMAYEFDGASVPRCLWGFFEPMGRHAKPAAVHDFLYAGGTSRWMADSIFREALGALKEPSWKIWLAWLAVRLFGGGHYRSVSPTTSAGKTD